MSVMLRTPNAVPSMFAEEIGGGDAGSPMQSLGRRLLARLASYKASWGRDADTMMARYCPAVATSCGLLFIVGRPIVKAASVAVGFGP